jgi:hypothetical protein
VRVLIGELIPDIVAISLNPVLEDREVDRAWTPVRIARTTLDPYGT